MHTSRLGRDFIRHHEIAGGKITEEMCSLYSDPVGLPTIGIGHLDRSRAYEGITLSPARVMDLFADDLEEFEEYVECIGYDLPQHKFDALVDFAFNVGPEGIRDISSLVRGKDLDSSYVPARVHLYTKGGGIRLPGLIMRRTAFELLWYGFGYRPYACAASERLI
tara:strand:+ start:728 stop:1222 length:495 start_codon:yes stop_codon:yes gene_type:complete